jgi:hypothetical protein
MSRKQCYEWKRFKEGRMPVGEDPRPGRPSTSTKVKVKAALSGLFDTNAYWHIVSLPLTEFTPSSAEALHTKQA